MHFSSKSRSFLVVFLALSACLLNPADALAIEPIRKTDERLAEEPYKYVGLLRTDFGNKLGNGSGGVVAHPRILLSCAHNFVTGDKSTDIVWAAKRNAWFPKYHNYHLPSFDNGVPLVDYNVMAGYASSVFDHGNTHRYSLALDFAVAWGYEDLAKGEFGGFHIDGETALRSTETKVIAGYPGKLTKNRYMHRLGPWDPTPLRSPSRTFDEVQYEGYLRAFGFTTGKGQSGSPVWNYSWSENVWRACGIAVSKYKYTRGLAAR